MQKSPKYKSIDLNSVKDRQKYFKNLYDEVNKSRMAVETITSFKNTQLSFKKKIDQIQQELHSSVSRINLESKKNVVLKELINLMKGQMFNFQKTQKKQQQKNESQAEKKIKKIRYDIQQILQKHNEQIAKINSLKQSANSGRSQRVVFSNLFKKLQKQIKQNEEMYKENLIKSEIAKDKCKVKQIKSLSRMLQRDNTEYKAENNRISQTNIVIRPAQNNFFNTNDQDMAFITLQRQHSFQKQDRKKSYHTKEMSHSQIYEMKNSSRRFYDLISTYQNFIEVLKVHMGFSDINQGINFYKGIQKANQDLMNQIENYEDQICHYENQIRDINLQKRQSQCYENPKQLPVGSCRRIRVPTKKTEQFQEDQQIQNNLQILAQVGKLLNLPISNQKHDFEQLQILDLKLDELLQDTKFYHQFFNETSNNHIRTTTAHSQGNVVDILLQRMDRFNQCEKILDRNLFKQEYMKELGKTKKHKSKK